MGDCRAGMDKYHEKLMVGGESSYSDNNSLRVLQIAAFDGNAGDTGQILGFRQEMEKTIGIPMTFTNLEMREFYRSWGMRRFDADFAALANSFDLVIIGGGNFWSLDWEDSATGTTIVKRDSGKHSDAHLVSWLGL